ncbi:anther-specific protein BCP1-like [Tripterygium wilfordii]|uniref:anther-specific protein BCP1-like n=1 Tax=Tripterygium wilfordii TaxID=458696 RepID=UPI0018F7E73D|nr:anther-specific protein BCP1-like [Tripterygium wilfordii]
MARQIVVLALVLFAVIGYASAADEAPKQSPSGADGGAALAPVSGNDDSIGNTDDDASAPSGNGGDDEVVAGPVGSETGLGPSGETSKTGDATGLKVSAVAGLATNLTVERKSAIFADCEYDFYLELIKEIMHISKTIKGTTMVAF